MAKSMRGRKPIKDHKLPVTIYVKKSLITKLGDLPGIKDKLLNYLKKYDHAKETI